MGYEHLNIDERPISERPKAVDKRQELGHWEGDTVVGKSNGSSIATHVERKSRYLLVGKTDDKSAESMNSTTQQLFRASVFPKRLGAVEPQPKRVKY